MTGASRARLRRTLLLTGLVGLSGFVVWSAAFGPGDAATASEAIAATRPLVDQGGEVSPIPAGKFISGNGIIEPVGGEADIGADASGRIVEILVAEGDVVAAGAPLARLDPSGAEAALRTAEAEVSVRRAQLSWTKRGTRREDLDAAIAEAEAARARADRATMVHERSQRLVNEGAVSADELDRVLQEREAARATFDAADARRRSAVGGARYEDILVARAQLAAAEARRDEAVVTRDRLTIHAPWPGSVLQIKFRVGERYSPEKGAFAVLGDASRLVARVDVDERDLASLQLGARAFVTVPAQPGRRVSGEVIEIGRRMGRKNIRTDDPVERIDTKILEVVVALEENEGLVPGLRIVGYIGGGR